MNERLLKTLRNWKVILLFIILASAIWTLQPSFWSEGVAIKGIAKNSSAELAGMKSPASNTQPMSREVILAINNIPVNSEEQYYDITSKFTVNQTVTIKTTAKTYRLAVRERTRSIILNETENVTVEETVERNVTVNGTRTLTNVTVNVTKEAPKVRVESLGPADIGIRVSDAPTSNLRKGIDLQGGTRVILKPTEDVSDDLMDALLDNMKERLNVYGLSDVVIAQVRGKSILGEDDRFVLVEMAGVSEDEVRDLLSRQGKFEAKIANQTVFKGGDDVTYVCRTAHCSGIDPNRGCGTSAEGYACGFFFEITLSPEAAARQSEATAKLGFSPEDRSYLSEPIILYLDNQEVDRLQISSELRGRAVTAIAISGSGAGPTLQDAQSDTLRNMKRLQTILITGSLPTTLEVVRADALSPALGEEFTKNAWMMAIIALICVAGILIAYYRSFAIAVPIMFTSLSEILIVLGMAALVGWSIDVAAIAGLIASVGTGVNDQIVITDETLRGGTGGRRNWKDKLKSAFFIVFSAATTLCVAMIPLWVAGAGLLKGFAITTILGVLAGVLITRPAYAVFVEALYGDKEQ